MKRFLARFAVACVVIALIGLATYELIHSYLHVYEPNARVQADFTVLSSSVDGTISSIGVKEGDRVSSGQRLAWMDNDVAGLDVRSMQAELEKERAIRAQVEAELTFYHSELDDRIRTSRASLTLRAKELSNLNERQEIARGNVDRNNKLLNRSAVSRQLIEDAQDKLLDIVGKTRDLETDIIINKMQIAELVGQKQRDSIYRSRLSVIDRNIDRLEVLIAQSKQRMLKMDVFSPIDGVVNEIYQRPGSYVEDGDKVFLLHDPDQLWIEADIDESDIRHVQPGQRVIVELDAYPFEDFEGKVRGIGHVTRSNIALQDSTGNGSPGAERIPITIDFPPIGKPVWPGMRAAVNIVIR